MTAHTDSITLTCPICKRDHTAPLTRRIDIDADKSAKEKILRGGPFALVDLDYAAALMRGFEEV